MHGCAEYVVFFFFNDTATTEIYTLSLHDALPIYRATGARASAEPRSRLRPGGPTTRPSPRARPDRSEEHTSELQSPCNLVCRLLLEKKKLHTNIHLFASLMHNQRTRLIACQVSRH